MRHVSLLAFLFISVTSPRAYAQTGGGGKLFGYIDNSAAGQTSSFVSIDVATGAVTTVATVAAPGLEVFGSALDLPTHRYFLVGCIPTPPPFSCSNTEGLIVLNPQTGGASPVIPIATSTGNLFPQFDPASGRLFGNGVSIDPTNGAVIALPSSGLSVLGSAIDPAMHRYFLVGCVPNTGSSSCSPGGALRIVSTAPQCGNGPVLSTQSCSNPEGSITPIITPTGNLFPQFDPGSGNLFGYIDNSAAGKTSTFVSINPTNAAVNTIATVAAPGLEVFGTALDLATHRYFLVGCVPDLTTPQPFSCSSEEAVLALHTDTGMQDPVVPLMSPTGNLFPQFEPTTLPATPGFLISPTSLRFGNVQFVGSASAAQTLSISNVGNAPLTISGISEGNDFKIAPGTTCHSNGGDLPPGGNCLLNVTFDPTIFGPTFLETINIADNATGSPNFATLSGGTAIDLNVYPASTTTAVATVAAGQTATFTLQVSFSLGFGGTVALTCSSPNSTITCSVPSSVGVSQDPDQLGFVFTPFTVSAVTAARSASAPIGRREAPPSGIEFRMLAVTLIEILIFALAYWRRMRWRSASFLAAVLFCLALSSCGSNRQSTSGQAGTSAGTYKLSVTATVVDTNPPVPGSVTRTLPLTLNVQ